MKNLLNLKIYHANFCNFGTQHTRWCARYNKFSQFYIVSFQGKRCMNSISTLLAVGVIHRGWKYLQKRGEASFYLCSCSGLLLLFDRKWKRLILTWVFKWGCVPGNTPIFTMLMIQAWLNITNRKATFTDSDFYYFHLWFITLVQTEPDIFVIIMVVVTKHQSQFSMEELAFMSFCINIIKFGWNE